MRAFSRSVLSLTLLCSLSLSCVDPSSDVDAEDAPAPGGSARVAEGLSAAPRLVQRGISLVLRGVTDDDVAIYQDGDSLYATALAPEASRRFVAKVDPDPSHSLVLVAGKVVFVWTAWVGGTSRSPLVVWTSAAGAKPATDAAIPTSFAAAASPDGRQIVFVANVDAASRVGDLVLASSDLVHRTTLLAGIDVDYAAAAANCSPYVGFAGRGERAYPAAAYCLAGSSAATLTTWAGGVRADVAHDLAIPPQWSADASGRTLVTTLAGVGNPNVGPAAVVTAEGSRVVDPAPTIPSYVRATTCGDVFEVTYEDTVSAVHATHPASQATRVVFPDIGITSVVTSAHAHNGFTYTADDRPYSKDGSLLLYVKDMDPTTGLFSFAMLDLAQNPAQQIPVDDDFDALPAHEFYTASSSHALYYKVDAGHPTSPLAALFAVARSGQSRRLSDGFTSVRGTALTAPMAVHPTLGSQVAFSDRIVLGTRALANATGDLVVVDLATARAPRIVARGAYLNHYPTFGGRGLAFTSDADPTAPGLYLAPSGA